MSKLGHEQRREERVKAALPVNLGTGTAVTRDVSASGLYFETDREFAAGSGITFSIDLETPGGVVSLWCQGRIVRVDENGAQRGVAVKIVESTLKPQDTAGATGFGA